MNKNFFKLLEGKIVVILNEFTKELYSWCKNSAKLFYVYVIQRHDIT